MIDCGMGEPADIDGYIDNIVMFRFLLDGILFERAVSVFRIMVVDAEPIVVSSLIDIIKNNIDASVQVWKAYNGRDGIVTALQIQPDIVITDIKMPGISGLEMIKEIKQMLPYTRFIILTAYEQFSFAKEAIALGVDGYLLKPIDRMRVIESIKSSSIRVAENRDMLLVNLTMKERIKKIMPEIKSMFLLSVLFLDNDIKSKCELLELRDEAGCILVIEARARGSENMTEQDMFLKLGCDYMKQIDGCMVCPVTPKKIAAFLPVSVGEHGINYIKEVARSLIEVCGSKHRYIAVGIGNVCNDFETLRDSYGKANIALGLLKTDNSSGALLYIDDAVIDQNERTNLSGRFNNLLKEIKMNDFGGVMDEYEGIFYSYVQLFNGDFYKLKLHLAEFLTMLAARVCDIDALRKYDLIEPVVQVNGMEELRSLCRDKVQKLFFSYIENDSVHISELIQKANIIIENNYTDRISLEGVAKEIGIAPSYFSRLYKQQTGNNFIDYVIKLRVDFAKKLISSTTLSIKEISYKTGYVNPNYFCKSFKKITGMAPTEYKLYCRNGGSLVQFSKGGQPGKLSKAVYGG